MGRGGAVRCGARGDGACGGGLGWVVRFVWVCGWMMEAR